MIYRFNTVPNKISVIIFTEVEKNSKNLYGTLTGLVCIVSNGFNRGGQWNTRTSNLGPCDSKQRIADYHFRLKLKAKFIKA